MLRYLINRWVCTAEHKRFVQLIDMRFKDINGYMEEMSGSIDKYLQVSTTLLLATRNDRNIRALYVSTPTWNNRGLR